MNKRKNRAYKLGEPYRDARLFILICEGGKREKTYFEALVKKSQRVKIHLLAPTGKEDGKSAPKWLLDRAATYEEEHGAGQFDQLWFVMDVDSWAAEDLRSIARHCEEKTNWFPALSNPCFEVWLFLHVAEIDACRASNCQDLKAQIHQLVPGGYKVERFILNAHEALQKAKACDASPAFFLPDFLRTKVYLLVEELMG